LRDVPPRSPLFPYTTLFRSMKCCNPSGGALCSSVPPTVQLRSLSSACSRLPRISNARSGQHDDADRIVQPDRIGDLRPAHDPTDRAVAAVERWCVVVRDEVLRAFGVAAGTGHTHHTGLEAQCAQLAAQTGRRTAIAVRVVEVAALQDEIRLDAMEREAAESSRPRIIEQCGHGEWSDERIQLHDE